jgi:hypothetical protein
MVTLIKMKWFHAHGLETVIGTSNHFVNYFKLKQGNIINTRLK